MNGYQRDKIQDLPDDANEYMSCCNIDVEKLPEEYLKAVENDEADKIQAYLDKEKDPNAECAGETLLSKACALGKIDIVRMILAQPKVHLNMPKNGPPMAVAAENGHIDCVKAILDARLKCRPLLMKGWRAVLTILLQSDEYSPTTLLHILGWAVYQCRWEMVKRILLMNVYIPQKIMYKLVLQAIDKSQWGVAKDALERHFSGKHEILLEILYIQVYLRRWERVDEILRMIDESLVPEKNLVVSALEGDHESVRKLLEKKELKAKVICASFLVVAAAGTTETVAELFVGVKDTYTPQTYSDALFLAALGQHSEYLYLLLCHPEISSSYHDMARAHRMLELVCLDEAPNRSLINFFDNVMEAKWKPKHWKP